jgi:3-oxoacyl-[acyl-carrier-protein] synthase-3
LANGILKNVEIKGIACAVPERVVNNQDNYSIFGEENVQKFIDMTGVKTRRVAIDEQCASDLCYVAAKRLMEKLNWEASTIDALIFITQTPDYAVPATACVLQYRLGLSEECIAFDINLGCSAYVYGIWQAATMISTQNINRVLLLVGDTSNFGINPNDSATAMIFGDGGSATALEKTEGKEIKYFLKTKGSGYKYIMVPAGHARSRSQTISDKSEYELAMHGADVFNFTITDVHFQKTGQ